MKVLLILLDPHLRDSLLKSVLIWFFTGIVGCSIVYQLFLPGSLTIDLYGLTLLYSCPAILIAIPTLYFLQHFKSTPARVTFALSSILLTCCLIIGGMVFIAGEAGMIILVLSPFIPTAIICFFLIAGKQTLDPLMK